MNKKLVVAIGVGCVLLVAAGLLYVFREKLMPGLGEKTLPTGSQESTPKYSFTWQLWEDPAGFSFEYPKELKLNPHPEDETSYAHLELTSPDQPGTVTITVNDAEYPDIESWMSEDELVKGGSGLDTKVASMAAKKVALGKDREITAFIDWDQVVYVVDATGENRDYWKPIYNHVLDSFKLTPLEGESAEEFDDWLGGFETTGVDIVEAVEVIE